MADENGAATTPSQGMFTEPPREKRFPAAAVGIASVAIVILLAVLFMLGHRDGKATSDANTPKAADSYSSNLVVSGIQLSESESISGGKVTYVDGHIANHGNATVTGLTAQVSFPNDAGTAPQMLTVPVNLIRMREPYIDTQPVSAAPLAPGGEADFRLIFEGVDPAWNNKQPDIRFVRISTR